MYNMVGINLDIDKTHETIHISIDEHWSVEGFDLSVHKVAHWHGKLLLV